jgi:hypothetical protein
MHLISTPITIGAAAHVIHGTLPLVGDRIQERLNDETVGTLQLYDVEVHSHLQQKSVAYLASAMVPKSRIEYVLVSSGRHEAPLKRWNNRTRKSLHSAIAVLSSCCIEGDVHLPGGMLDTRYTYLRELSGFFALTNARVRILGAEAVEIPLVFANLDYVSCLQIGEVFGPNPEDLVGTADEVDVPTAVECDVPTADEFHVHPADLAAALVESGTGG